MLFFGPVSCRAEGERGPICSFGVRIPSAVPKTTAPVLCSRSVRNLAFIALEHFVEEILEDERFVGPVRDPLLRIQNANYRMYVASASAPISYPALTSTLAATAITAPLRAETS